MSREPLVQLRRAREQRTFRAETVDHPCDVKGLAPCVTDREVTALFHLERRDRWQLDELRAERELQADGGGYGNAHAGVRARAEADRDLVDASRSSPSALEHFE